MNKTVLAKQISFWVLIAGISLSLNPIFAKGGFYWECKVNHVQNDRLGIKTYKGARVKVFYDNDTGTIYRPTRTEIFIDAWITNRQGVTYKNSMNWDSGLPFEDTSPFKDLVYWSFKGPEWTLSFQKEESGQVYLIKRAPRESKFEIYSAADLLSPELIATGTCETR